jgi:hypothetical protein
LDNTVTKKVSGVSLLDFSCFFLQEHGKEQQQQQLARSSNSKEQQQQLEATAATGQP